MRNSFVLALLLFVFVPTVSAQTVPKNPTKVELDLPADYAQLTGFELEIRRKSDNSVLQVIVLGKGTATATTVTIPINVQPIAFGTYYGLLRAVAGTSKSDSSDPSNDFERAPGKPGGVRIGG